MVCILFRAKIIHKICSQIVNERNLFDVVYTQMLLLFGWHVVFMTQEFYLGPNHLITM